MDSHLIFLLWFLVSSESLFLTSCKAYPVGDKTLSPEVWNSKLLNILDQPLESDYQISFDGNSRERRIRRSDFEEEETNNNGGKGPAEDIAAIKQIVDLLRNVGQRVIPVVMQGASVLNNLLSNLGT